MQDWDLLDDLKYTDEAEAVAALLARSPLDPVQRAAIVADAAGLVRAARANPRAGGRVESFLQEFSLASREGLALMCLAEALLRTPDEATRDRLIAERIGSADWAAHAGRSESLFVNVSTWGLMLTGRLVEVDPEAKRDFGGYVKRLAARIGEPVIRQAVAAAIRMMGEQFVLAPTIGEALARADREGWLCSFDMLGEGARTAADAARYEGLYADAIAAVGADHPGDPETGHGISVKLSALFPRYEAVNEARVFAELYPRLRRLAVLAAGQGLNLAIDAEEADRLVLSLKLIERLTHEPDLGAWTGLGVVVQAYQKRGVAVIDRLADLAARSGRRIMVRLVKGAYWDSEIKRAQVAGLPDYPVFTTKPATDLSYLVCARALIAASPALYPQFATHNAHTLAAVRAMAAAAGVAIEHQRLHGMGESLYAAAEAQHGPLRLRAYAPVGGHADLLPYLVRRLLENGANTSFVHSLLDPEVPVETLVQDPIGLVEAAPGRHPRIPKPANIYGDSRRNSAGRDLSQKGVRDDFASALKALPLNGGGLGGGDLPAGRSDRGKITPTATTRLQAAKSRSSPIKGEEEVVESPVDGAGVGHVSPADSRAIDAAANAASLAWRRWDAAGGPARAQVLNAMADALENHMEPPVALLAREAGKTLADGVAEVREAADFCRYYAHLAATRFAGAELLDGPVGESNRLELRARGVFACISPWNFPLAIFTAQIAAALAAGNAVLAKPAEQTPLIADEAVRLFHQAGLDPDLLHLLPGSGEAVGARLVAHPLVAGVAFTGGTETSWAINRALAARKGPIIPFIAETGGLNAMFADTSALAEQLVDDVILSAFGSAGQRCSALRILFLPEETADALIEKIAGAMDELAVGDPALASTDVGPVIDAEAKEALEKHLRRLKRDAKILKQVKLGHLPPKGHWFAPVMAEIPTPDFLQAEVFGPILHVIRYRRRDLPVLATTLAALGYGLTLGIHSRVDSFADEIRALVPAGNCYVNRSIIGAVVGVQPFGGEGLSGTGPKAGGPNSLGRYAVERTISVNIAAMGGDPTLMNL